MVFNAMKLFMEINPQLFDECSHNYTEDQSNQDKREQDRQSQWDRIAEQARINKGESPTESGQPVRPKVNAPPRIDEVDPMTQDSQQRLDALKLQDEGVSGRDRDSSAVSGA
jgi:serine/threonine-protein phosphatase 2A regulatory subunit B'